MIDDTPALRTLPHNLEAEKAFLGAMFVDGRVLSEASTFLKPEHFALPEHGLIYDSALKLIERGSVADHQTLRGFFLGETMSDIGGLKYMAELINSAVTHINAVEYAGLIVNESQKRQLISLGREMIDRAFSGDVDETPAVQIETAERQLYELTDKRRGKGQSRTFDRVTKSALDQAEAARQSKTGILGIATGLTDVDRVIGGLAPSDLVILGGRPAMGKTALAITIAYNAAAAGIPVQVFSLEMSAEQLCHRIIATKTDIDQEKISRGRTNETEHAKVEAIRDELSRLPLHIDDTGALASTQILARARLAKRRYGVGLIVVDHIGLVRAKAENRTQEITKISGALKEIAKELEVPVLALSQLSRAVEQRDNKRPCLGDLRESGSIEQDADIVTFLYRAAYYLEREEPQRRKNECRESLTGRVADWHEELRQVRNDAELIIAKNRHGRTCKIDLHFAPEFARFGCRDQGRAA